MLASVNSMFCLAEETASLHANENTEMNGTFPGTRVTGYIALDLRHSLIVWLSIYWNV